MWSPKTAENHIRTYARNPDLELAYTRHANKRMEERGIIMSDILHILKCGHIDTDNEPEETTQPNFHKYEICGKSPNSGSREICLREICLIVVPDPSQPAIKVITVMWRDL